MNCPVCNNARVCGCEACREGNIAKGLVPWIILNETPGSFDEACPQCGLLKDAHEWMEIEYQEYKKQVPDLGGAGPA